MIKNKSFGLFLLIAATVLSVTAMVVSILFIGSEKKTEFIPPPFDSTAQSGIPEVAENLGYNELYQDGMAYRFSVCGKITIEEQGAIVYLTNSEENDVWLKVRLYNEKDELLGESGLIKPNEYVKSIPLDTVPPNGAKIKLKIMGYVPESYRSAGAVILNSSIFE